MTLNPLDLPTIIESITSEVAKGKKATELFQLYARNSGFTVAQIRYAFYNEDKDAAKSHGNQKLTDEQNKVLEALVISFSACSLPQANPAARNCAQTLERQG